MKAKILIVLVIAAGIVYACNKDKYTDNPQLTFKSVNTTTIGQNGVLTFTLGFTFKKNGLDSLFITRISKTCPGSVVSNLSNFVPKFTGVKNQDGDLEINLPIGANGINSCQNKIDSSYFKFCLQDVAGKRSDTIISPIIAILPN
ncbi:hypothetical protein ACI6Q2_19770 [Chitinophagaceae bacterium LWZ2-11]